MVEHKLVRLISYDKKKIFGSMSMITHGLGSGSLVKDGALGTANNFVPKQ